MTIRIVEIGDFGDFLIPLPHKVLKELGWSDGDSVRFDIVSDRNGKSDHVVLFKDTPDMFTFEDPTATFGRRFPNQPLHIRSSHQDGGERCLVSHYVGDYRTPIMLDPCIRCTLCHQWIRPEDMGNTCHGRGDA